MEDGKNYKKILPHFFFWKEPKKSYREIPAVKWMDDKGLISQVDDPRDTIARLEGCHGTGDELTAREVLDGPMIITVLNILQGKHKQGLEYKKQDNLSTGTILPIHHSV